ncbi:unnamed protein product, partial [Mesorhabditis belari]|uniref:IRS-type PTB domain-containing protein n=1 Tax=Mesorhabditis belari TaxID=2138241 RepID=A0AAF3EIY8_9BILA
MRDRVDLNSNGNSIESPVKIFKGDRWTPRYILCKKHADLMAPIFMVYKNQASRNNHHQFKASFALQNYIGLESGFELKKQQNTLAILTKDEVIVLAFSIPENLIIWETWLKNACGHSQTFYVQLQRVPKYSIAEHLLRKEVRLHLHDSCFALVHGRPQIILEYINTADAQIFDMRPNSFTFASQDSKSREDSYTISSTRLPIFYALLEKAKRNEDELNAFLSSKVSDGDWMPEVSHAFARAHSLRSNPSENIRGYLSYMNSPMIYKRDSNLDKGKSKSGNHVSSLFVDRRVNPTNLNRATSLANYYNTGGLGSPYMGRERTTSSASHNYVNVIEIGGNSESRGSSFRSRIYIGGNGESSVHYCNIDEAGVSHETNQPSANIRSSSLPDYVNIDLGTTNVMKSPRPQKRHHKLSQVLYSNLVQTSSPHGETRRRSDNSVWIFRDKSKTRFEKQNSVGNFNSSDQLPSAPERHENWKRAKKFISAFKPRSENHLTQHSAKKREMTKSNSTSALSFASPARKKHHSSISSFATEHSDEEIALPPALNLAMNDPLLAQGTSAENRPLEGLVKVKEFPMITARSGVGAILAKRLQSTVRGSFTKYDGERATHHYNPGNPKEELPQTSPKRREGHASDEKSDDPLDGIVSAVKSGRERLKESDRRASAVSFKNLLLLPRRLSKSAAMKAQALRNSSVSESTRSSNESLSSGVKSKISFKKRASSPPRMVAPTLEKRPSSQRTLVFQQSSSIDSFNSHQTARSSSPITLPRKAFPSVESTPSIQSELLRQSSRLDYCQLAGSRRENGSSSSNSVGSRSDYVSICPMGTKAAQESCSGKPRSVCRVCHFSEQEFLNLYL